jgi:hypothetical protein
LAASAAWAGEDVDGEDAAEEVCPGKPGGSAARRVGRGGGPGGLGGCAVGGGGGECDDAGSQSGAGSEDAGVSDQVSPRRRQDAGEASKEVDGRQNQVGSAIGPGALESIGHQAGGGHGDALAGEGGSSAVAAEALDPGAVTGGDLDGGVEREAVEGDRAAVDEKRRRGRGRGGQETSRLDRGGLDGGERGGLVVGR